MKSLIPVMSFVALLTLTSCAMLTSWKSIPPLAAATSATPSRSPPTGR